MNNTRVADVLHYLSLILILTVCSFLVLFYEISAYSNVNDKNEAYDSTHLPLLYLQNKMRSANEVSCENNVLIITNGKLDTLIYLYDGNLLELTTLKDAEIDHKAGEKIFEMDSFEVKENEDKIYISYSVKGKEKETTFSLRSDKHE